MLAKKSFVVFAGKAASAVANAGLTVVLARLLGVEGFGLIGTLLSYKAVLYALGEFGFSNANMKRMSEKGADTADCIKTHFAIRATTGALVVLGATGWASWQYTGGEELNIALLYLLFGVVAGLDNVTDVFISTFDARQEVWKSQVARVLQNIAGGGITIGLVFISPTVLMAGIGYAAQYGVKFAVAGYLGRVYPWGRVRKSLFKRYWSFALPNMLASMVGFVYMHVDRLLLKGLAGAEAVGYLYGSQKFAKLLLMVSGATLNLVMTEASELHSMGKEQELQRLANQSQKYLSLLTAPMIAGLVIFAEPLVVTVLGADYLPSVIVLQLLGVQVFGMTISRPLGMMLYGIDRPGLGSTFSVITLAVGVGLTFMLVPDTLLGAPMVGLGVVGVAVSLGVRGLLSWGLLAFTLRYLANIQIYLRPIWHLAGAFSVTGAAYYLLHAQSAVVQLVTAPIIVAPLYTGFLYLVNEAGQKEFNVLLRALNLKPLGS